MKNLIIEASGPRLIVQTNVNSIAEISPDDGRHDQRLQSTVEAVLARASLSYGDLTSLSVGAGPGSFTGIRVALSFCQGLATALDIPVRPLDSLCLVALRQGEGLWHVAEDARLGEVYEAVYQVSASGVEVKLAPQLQKLEHVSAQGEPLGSAWALFEEKAVEQQLNGYCPAWQHYAESVEPVSPLELTPVYLRDTVPWKKLAEQPRPLG